MTNKPSPIWHPFTQHGLMEDVPMVARASGATLFTEDGREIIDAISSWWVTTHGHCYPPIMDAIMAQAQKLDQIIFAGWTHEPAEKLARGLVDIMPAPLAHVFYSDSGSTSVEVALKMALGYWQNRNDPRHHILVLEHGYHGDTIGTMSVGARGVFNQAYDKLLFDVGCIPFPSPGREQACLDRLEKSCREDAPAAFIVEPLILGAGGMRVYSANILAEMRKICAHHNVLFIADEVMTAWGRTGTMLACEQANIVPDILCLSKGITGGSIPLAVTMATGEIFEAHYSTDKAKMFYHSSSYTANPLACAAGLANLAVWRNEPVEERIATLVKRQKTALEKLSAYDGFENPRQMGTMIAIDVIEKGGGGYLSNIGPKLLGYFKERDLLTRPLGNVIYVMPPYCINQWELDKIHKAIGDLDELNL